MRHRCSSFLLGQLLVILAVFMPKVVSGADKDNFIKQPWTTITPQIDAAGGCDGIKNGEWGFHTDYDTMPWWQVDLGKVKLVARVVIWNRCNAESPRANYLTVKLSDNGRDWRTVYKHNGNTFFGYTDSKPLVVELKDQACRWVRIQLPDYGYLHLDEVEVFGPVNPDKNLALNRPANQISISKWSIKQQNPEPANWVKLITTTSASQSLSAYIKKSTPVETYITSVANYIKSQRQHGRWHIIGPFDENDQTFPSGDKIDFEAEQTGQNNQPVRWMQHKKGPFDILGWISLDTLPSFSGSFPIVGYLGQYIFAPVAQEEEAQIVVGAPSGAPWIPMKFKAWLNGKPLTFEENTYRFRLALKAGDNYLLVRIKHSQKGRLKFMS
ncbi:MAG: discoidin domain-containing protein, partial [Planctomycetota bacterium]